MLKDVLKSRRNALKLKQAEVAKHVKVTPQTYLKWESGEYEPKASQIKKLAEILKVTESEICKGYLYDEKGYEQIDFMRKMAIGLKYLDNITIMTYVYHYINEKDKFIADIDKELELMHGYNIEEFRERRIPPDEKDMAILIKHHMDDETDLS